MLITENEGEISINKIEFIIIENVCYGTIVE